MLHRLSCALGLMAVAILISAANPTSAKAEQQRYSQLSASAQQYIVLAQHQTPAQRLWMKKNGGKFKGDKGAKKQWNKGRNGGKGMGNVRKHVMDGM